MLTRLGRSDQGESLLDLLRACHERIRRFAAIAVTLSRPDSATRPAAELRDGADAVRRYFAVALPLHAADEEHSLVPRLRGRAAALDAALATMTAEHLEHQPDLGRVVELCAALAAAPERHAELAPALAEPAARLADAFARHLQLEEEVIFPVVATLPAEVQAAIVGELRARRAA